MPYSAHMLLPSAHQDAAKVNTPLLGPTTLGVEVTEPALGAACGLGNIDPQHTTDVSSRRCELAAVDVALVFERLPPPGARLVTIRPDLDALGAMAVLRLRAEGAPLTAGLCARVGQASRMDRYDTGPWPGPSLLPETDDEWLAFAEGPFGLASLAAYASEPAVPLEKRVAGVGRWLASGESPAPADDAVGERAGALAEAWRASDIGLRTVVEGRVAVVRSTVQGALRLGYALAPVVIALVEPAEGAPRGTHRKVSIAQHDLAHADFRALARALAAEEPGWGGSDTILGSTQGKGTALPLGRIVEAVAAHLR